MKTVIAQCHCHKIVINKFNLYTAAFKRPVCSVCGENMMLRRAEFINGRWKAQGSESYSLYTPGGIKGTCE